MWIVALALRRPYTFIVVSILILILGALAIVRTPKDIFPNVNIPVVSEIWNYGGLSAQEMANRITTGTERSLTTTVNDIQHIESQTLSGIAVVKIFFQPGVNMSAAIAQVTAIAQTQLRQLPPGTTPPLVITYNASTVPIIQLGLSGNGLSEQDLNDIAVNFVRTQLITVPGTAVPYPYGGKARQIQVDLDPQALQSKGLSPMDVVNAISAQNLILPSGTAKIGSLEYAVEINGSALTVPELDDIPIKAVGNTTIYVHDVAHVRDGFPPQTNIARANGKRGALLTVQKSSNTSTLDIIDGVKQTLQRIKPSLPANLEIHALLDQSIFVRAAIDGVVREALIAACLTGGMILLFLGSWRSTLIIAASIPLSILCSIVALNALGETINIMTLGGLALAVGILVDDATVEIENINRNLEEGKETEKAILDGAAQIAVPAFVSTLCICIVFVPMFFLTGVARFLFVPLAEAVVFAMLASYFLSRTLVPTLAKYLLKPHRPAGEGEGHGFFGRFQARFERGFEHVRGRYRTALEKALDRPGRFVLVFLLGCLAFVVLVPFLGQDFFPAVDSGQFKLHLRARTGMRIEETARLCDMVERAIREEIPKEQIGNVIDVIGLPYSGINLSYSNSAPIGSADADILVSLAEGHEPTAKYVRSLRLRLARQFAGVSFAFLPADMVTQILNFGLPAPIDVQVVGNNVADNRVFANDLLREARSIPGLVDLRIQQAFDLPNLRIDVDRTRAQEIGFTERDVAGNLLVSLSGSFQTSPSYYLNPKNGVSYSIATQTPQYRIESVSDLQNIPVSGGTNSKSEILGNLASFSRGTQAAVVSHYNVQPVIDLYGSVQGRDLGGVARDLVKLVDGSQSKLPKGSQTIIRGQIETMRSSYSGLLSGLAFAILLVYLLIVINFQSWLDPFIIISALPAALAGIVWFLFVTGSTVSVPALTGAIMCMGVATANSILVVSFAREQLAEGVEASRAALEAGFTRFRPVLMTALAMMIGMVPMALGLGEGGEQNAPLGRAVIGGLLFATVSTLLFVPVLFSLMRRHRRETR